MKAPSENSGGPGKTVRFKEVIKSAGQPEAVTLWQDPEKDPRVKKARKENRVMTVTQAVTGSKKDFGVIGFELEPNASYLLFPKTLRPFEGRRVVGINYDLLRSPKPAGDVYTGKGSAGIAKRAVEKQPPAPKHFKVQLRCSSVVDLVVEVEAQNAAAARKVALKKAEEEPIDFSQATRKFVAQKVSPL